MNKTALVSVLATLTFGVITVHLARSLGKERELASNADASLKTTARTQTQSSIPEDGVRPELSATSLPANPAEDKILAATMQLQNFSDPKLRSAIVARKRESLAQSWKPISASMGMPDSTLDNLLDALSEQATSHDQRRLECQIDRFCDLQTLNASLQESARYNLESYLGPELLDRYKAYRNSIPERATMQDFQSRLPSDGRVDDKTAERLVITLAAERERFVTSMEQSGRKIQISGFVVKDYEGDRAPRAMGGPVNQLLTDQFGSKLIDAASGILSSDQLAEFKTLQEERVKNAKLMSGLLPN